MNKALKLYAFLSDLILTRCWQIPPTPSGFGLPRQARPSTKSSKMRFVNKTPKQNPSKLYLWAQLNRKSNAIYYKNGALYNYLITSRRIYFDTTYLEKRFKKSSGIEYDPVKRLTFEWRDLKIVISETVSPIHSELPSSSKSSVWYRALASYKIKWLPKCNF